jgi:integrating conjugative element protein (TIGR03761 family)
MRIPDIGSKQPLVVPVRFASRLGFQLVYQLLKVDQIVLKVLLANHIGLLPNREKFETLKRVEKRVRSVIHMVFVYRHTGVTRDDVAANNKKAEKAIEMMGDLEPGYLDGSLRSDNAPPLPAKRLQTLGKTLDTSTPEAEKVEEADVVDIGDEIDKVVDKAKAKAKARAKKPTTKAA